MAGQAIIVASYSYNSDTDLSPVKQALEQPSMNLSPGKHYSFNVGQLAWHLISGTIPWFQLSIVNHRVLRLFLREYRRSRVDLRPGLRHQLPSALRAHVPRGAAENGTYLHSRHQISFS
jgi:hypothetical protein